MAEGFLGPGEALAALDMILSAAKLASPPILGGLYAAFVEVGRPEMMFLAAGVSGPSIREFGTDLVFRDVVWWGLYFWRPWSLRGGDSEVDGQFQESKWKMFHLVKCMTSEQDCDDSPVSRPRIISV